MLFCILLKRGHVRHTETVYIACPPQVKKIEISSLARSALSEQNTSFLIDFRKRRNKNICRVTLRRRKPMNFSLAPAGCSFREG